MQVYILYRIFIKKGYYSSIRKPQSRTITNQKRIDHIKKKVTTGYYTSLH